MSWIPESFRDRPYARQHFAAIVDKVAAEHPFYKQRIPGPESAIPLLTRTDILENNDALLNGHPETTRTSGSTGVPVRIAQSRRRQKMAQQDIDLFIKWLGGPLERGRIIHTGTEAAEEDKLDIKTPHDEQIDWLLKRRETVDLQAVTTYPTNAELLSRRVIERGIDMSFVTRFGCFAEAFEPHHEEAIKAAFPNAKIWTSYSSMEFGLVAVRCPLEPDFHHILAHRVGVEILDDDGQPCPNGEIGRMVITDYFNDRSPLIRYEIGDLAARGDCPCGKIPYPALSKIVGKTRGALLHRDGNRVLFAELSVALRDLKGMRQYQVEQLELEKFIVRVVTESSRPLDAEFEGEIHAAFESHFGYPVEITFENIEGEIPLGQNGKFYASICRI